MRMRCSAELQQRAEQRGDVAPARSPTRRARTARRLRPACGWSGKRSTPSSNSTGSVSAQLSRNAARSPSTAGPVDAEVGVAPLVLVAGVALPLVGDADAAGEADRLVDDQHLAVGAVVHLSRAGAGAAAGTSARARRPASMLVDERRGPWGGRPRRRAARAPARPPRPGRRAASANSRADLALPVDEGQEVDRVLGVVDRVEHRREDLVAVAQDVDAVALGRRARR